MSDVDLFTIQCPSCADGIEFPAHGIGQQIECPHCQSQVTLRFPIGEEDDPALQLQTFLRSGSFPTEERDLVVLSLFASPAEPSVLSKPGIRYASNDAEARQVVDHFVANGLLQDASSDLAALLQIESSATLKALVKDRKLPHSGTKSTLAKRLVKADPEAMRARYRGKRFLVRSVKGSILVEKWREADRHRKEIAEKECLHALKEGRLKDACLAMAAYEATRLIPRGVGMDWRNYDMSHDLLVLRTILAAHLSRHAHFDVNILVNMRVAAAMTHLWGVNDPSPWMPERAEEGQLNWAVETRMLVFHALNRSRLHDMTEAGIERVAVLGSGWPDDCPACRADCGKIYAIGDAPSLPHEDCTCESGCRCVVTARQQASP